MKRSEVNRSKISPMMLQYLEVKDKYPDTVIFYRIGDFYEMFFEDAEIGSKELELALTGKQAGLEERVPMCGIPHHAYKPYLDKLIERGYKVAICEQLTEPKPGPTVVERDVIQVVTKGTRLDDMIDAKESNYIASVYDFEYCFGVSYADISTGYFYVSVLDHEKDKVISEIVNHGVKEVIVNAKIDRSIVSDLREHYQILVSIEDELLEEGYEIVYRHLEDVREKTSLKHLLYYIQNTKKGELSHFQPASVVDTHHYLQFDIHTKKNLELTETMRTQDRTYSLFWLLDKNKTAMGSRFLKYNIENPLCDRKEIERRYDFIEKLRTEFILKDELKEELNAVYDLERLAGRISYGNLNARDLLQLKTSLRVCPRIKEILAELSFDKTIEGFEELYQLLENAINEDAPVGLKEGGLIKPGYAKELDDLKTIRSGSKDFILQLESEERERTGIKTLKVGYNKVFGYYIEVSKGSIPLIKDEFGYERKQTLSNCERFSTPLLKEKENIILGAEEKIINMEYQLFQEVRTTVKGYIGKIQQTAKVISEIDFLQALATVADENNYVRPQIATDRSVRLLDARHPVVEKVLRQDYIPNDIILGEDTDILLITGPNMAGKSTYMRQFAIIVIMAQIGSFVPCKSAILPIFDKIFTRIGASDDLVSGESTFMVEMNEANKAISEATPQSLILFDELGRGTATYDGMSLAQAILEYIHDKIGAKTLFSTHYHELTRLAGDLPRLRNVHVSAVEEDGKITFLHKVKNGAVDKSYGIHVASLAHLPQELIARASEILGIYENKDKKKQAFTQTSLFLEPEEKVEVKISKVEEELKQINPLELTPIEALQKLYDLVNEAKEK